MQKSQYAAYIAAAKETIGGEYYAGYHKGLARHFHGDAYGSEAEHEAYMHMSEDRQERGDGYRDGFAGLPPRGMHGNIGNRNPSKAPDDVASAQIQVRCTPAEKNRAVRDAQAHGMKLSQYILYLLDRNSPDRHK